MGWVEMLMAIFQVGSTLFNAGSSLWKTNYEQDLQKKEWEREDSGMQRKIADYKAAGMSPVLAAGGSSYGSTPIQVQAPEVDGAGLLSALTSLMKTKQDISTSAAQEALLRVQGKILGETAMFDIAKHKSDAEKANYDASQAYLNYDKSQYDYEWYKKNGLPTDATGSATDAANWTEMLMKKLKDGDISGVTASALLGLLSKIR